MRYSLLVFEGSKAVGEFKIIAQGPPIEALTKLKPWLTGVLLDDSGVIAQSLALSTDNPWYSDKVRKVL